MKKYTLLFIFSISIISSIAQDTTRNTLELTEIIIREKRKAAELRAETIIHAQSVGVLMEKDLNRNNPIFIEQSLGMMAGVQVDRRTQLGGQRLVIRGYGNDQKFNNWGVKIYYNGIPLTTADGVTILDDIDFGLVSRIDVIKGPAATMYGGGVGGVARFSVSPVDRKGFTITEKMAVGSFGLFQAQTRLDLVKDSSAITLNYGHIQSDGFRVGGSSLKNLVSLFGEYKASKKQSISYFFSHNFSKEGVSGQIPYADYYARIDNGNPAYLSKNSRNELLTTRFAISHNYNFFKNFSNQTSVFYSNQDFLRVAAGADELSMNPNYGFRSVFYLNSNINGRFSNELSFGTEVQQSRSMITNFRFLGTDAANPLRVRDISTGSYFRTTSNQSSYFAVNKLRMKPLDLTLILGLSANNINYDRVDMLAKQGLLPNYNRNLGFTKKFETSYNPHIALQKEFSKQILTLSYSEGFNAPTAATAFIAAISKANDDLLPEKARMIDLSIQGTAIDNKLDYQFSVFNIDIYNKLTQLSGVIPTGGTYTYFANTGKQKNSGFEASLSYLMVNNRNGFIRRVEPFLNYSYYDFNYVDFKTRFEGVLADYSSKRVVGVPKNKYTFGLDIDTKTGLYWSNTYNFLGEIYTDFANTNLVKSYALLNSKVGYNRIGKKVDFDIYLAGNNLTNQINYTFLFLGNNVNDTDPGSIFRVATDVNPGPSKAYYFGGVNLKLKF